MGKDKPATDMAAWRSASVLLAFVLLGLAAGTALAEPFSEEAIELTSDEESMSLGDDPDVALLQEAEDEDDDSDVDDEDDAEEEDEDDDEKYFDPTPRKRWLGTRFNWIRKQLAKKGYTMGAKDMTHHKYLNKLKKAYKVHKERIKVLPVMYRDLDRRYQKLRGLITKHVKAIMKRKYAWLKLMFAKRRFKLMTRRYAHMVRRYKHLPKSRFLSRAWRRYQGSVQYAMDSKGKYKLTCNKAKKYLGNLKVWVKNQRAALRDMRHKFRRFIQSKKGKIKDPVLEKMRVQFRRKLRVQRKRVRRVLSFWRRRIETGRLPSPETKPTGKKSKKPRVIPVSRLLKKERSRAKKQKKKHSFSSQLKNVAGNGGKGRKTGARRLVGKSKKPRQTLKRGNKLMRPLRKQKLHRSKRRANRRAKRRQKVSKKFGRRMTSKPRRKTRGLRKKWKGWKKAVRGAWKKFWKKQKTRRATRRRRPARR